MLSVATRALLPFLFTVPAFAQCPVWRAWNTQPSQGEFPLALATFDDGTGTAVYLAGQIWNFQGQPANGVLRSTGAGWQSLPLPDFSAIAIVARVLDLGPGPELVVGGFPGHWTWSAGAWQTSSTLPANWAIQDLEVFDPGTGPRLFAAVNLGLSGNGVAQFSGGAWSLALPAIGGYPTAIATYDDGTGPALYIGGVELTVNGAPAGPVLRWDGTTLSSIPQPLLAAVVSLRVLDDGGGTALFAGTASPDLATANFARVERFAAGAWAPIGETFESFAGRLTIEDFAVFDDGFHGPSLVVGGTFTHVGGLPCANVARFDGAAWRALGAGVAQGAANGPYVAALTVRPNGSAPDELVVAGTFTLAGGATATHVASWTGCAGAGAGFCAGDGVDPGILATCPCGNVGAVGHGCANSVNSVGALLDAGGRPEYDDVLLHAQFLPATAPCLFFKANSTWSGGFQAGDGILCVGGTLVRLGLQTTEGGSSFYPVPGQPSVGVRGGTVPGSGQIAYYQALYRNSAAAFCPPETINVTNGYVIAW